MRNWISALWNQETASAAQNVGSFISRAAAAASRASASLVPALALWVMAGRVRGGPSVCARAEPKRSEGNAAFSSLREARKSHSGVTNVPTGTTRQRGEVMRPVVRRILYLGKLTSGTKKVLADGKGVQSFMTSLKGKNRSLQWRICVSFVIHIYGLRGDEYIELHNVAVGVSLEYNTYIDNIIISERHVVT